MIDMIFKICTFFVFLINVINCYDDEILLLPGLTFTPNFKSFSGYLQVSSTRFLHYWFVESQSNPNKDPLVLWFNGGPGCSSLDGLLSEHGPYLISEKGYLTRNPYSWNRIANVLYIEAPAGVGFSYDTTNNFKSDDDITSAQNYAALQQFLIRYPQFRGRELWITGESYAGVYVPTLAAEIVTHGEFLLKGIMVGNGITSYQLNDDSLIYFGKYHGLFGDVLWDELVTNCCFNVTEVQRCYFSKVSTKACSASILKFSAIIDNGLNVYNLYQSCAGGVDANKLGISRDAFDSRNLFINNLFVHSLRKQMGSRLNLSPPCTNSTALTTYLNDSKVRQALHISPRFDNVSFDVCNTEVYMAYGRVYKDMTPIYQLLFDYKLPRIFVYNGDVDMACNFLGDEWFLDNLNLKLTVNRTAWFYRDEDGTKQVGGYTKAWTNNLIFATVRGSGHMVPQDKPVSSFYMFQRILLGQPL